MNKATTPGREEAPHRQVPHDDQCEFRRVKVNRCGCYERRKQSLASESQRESGWQPIASAPQEHGIELLLDDPEEGPFVGYWSANGERWQTSEKGKRIAPSHWQPLQRPNTPSESQRIVAESADETPDGQAENTLLDHP